MLELLDETLPYPISDQELLMALDVDALALLERINRKYGSGTAIVGSEVQSYGRFPTGSVGLDSILGGGWAANAWHEIVGEASSGKTNLAYATIAANQRIDPNFVAMLVAAEQYVGSYAQMCGVDTDRLLVVETNIMESAYDTIMDAAESRAVDCVVVDSLPMLVPLLEDEKDVGSSSVGRAALVTGQFFRKVGKAMHRSNEGGDRPFLGLLINQYRMKIGTMYGDPRTTPGGKAKDFACFTRVEIKRDEWIEIGTGKDKDRVGQTVKAVTIKNKSAPPQQTATYDIYFGSGGPVPAGQIDYAKELVTLGVRVGLIERKGAWYYFQDQQWQGLSGMTQAIREDQALRDLLDQEVRTAYSGAATE